MNELTSKNRPDMALSKGDYCRHQFHKANERTCWICFLTEADDHEAEWLHPCRCCGSTKWVHRNCLRRFIDQEQRIKRNPNVACPLCCTKYLMVLPDLSYSGQILKQIDRIATRICPHLGPYALLGTMFWTGLNYIIISLVNTLGLPGADALFANGDILVVLIGYPAIPIVSHISRALQFQSTPVSERTEHIPITPHIDNNTVAPPDVNGNAMVPSNTIMLLVALPTISSVFARIFFGFVKSPSQRFILGSTCLVAVRNLLRSYVMTLEDLRRKKVVVLDYTTENLLKCRSRIIQRMPNI